MSKIALGTVQFGINYGINSANGKVTSNEVDKILRYAKSCNIDLLDTAPAYGDSEQILGNSYSESFKIVTKTRHFECDQITHREVEFLVKDLHRSLKLLNRQSVYGVLIHNVNDLFKIGADKFFYKLQKLKQQGLIDKIGV
jgi:aryl-alcohol dehydrogenase-like predicted oxidoreductase